jgi:fatty-acyl-CoA synthase
MNPVIRRQTLSDVLRRTAVRLPNKVAIDCGEISWTYAEFDAVVTRVAAGFAAHGVGTGTRIAIMSRNSHAFAAVRFAVARLGAVLVPINFMLKCAEIAFILRHSGASRLCVDGECAVLAAQAAREVGTVDELIWLPSRKTSSPVAGMTSFDELASCDTPVSEGTFSADSLSQILYTSGTESEPKGAMHTHAAVISQYLSCLVDLEIEEADRFLHALPMYHTAQLDVFFGPSIQVGSYNVIIEAPIADEVLPLIAHKKITSLFAPPTVWISLLRAPSFETTDLRSLSKGYYGASIMPVEIVTELQRRLPALRLWNAYGQTEMGPLATVLKPADQLRKQGSAGKPCIQVETRVIREDGSDVTPGGEVGEIVHRSPHLMLGYLNDEERTGAAFAGGWFHSGDLASIDNEGYITVIDRKKDMIKTGGENVASREVEESIYRIPAVSEVAVLGMADPRWVEAVTAFIVLKRGTRLTAAEVIAHCGATLASFKLPKRVHFIDALPKTATGKVLKRELRTQFVAAQEPPGE